LFSTPPLPRVTPAATVIKFCAVTVIPVILLAVIIVITDITVITVMSLAVPLPLPLLHVFSQEGH